jgi:hypothetical protein
MPDESTPNTPESYEDRITAALDDDAPPEIKRLLAENNDFAKQVALARQFESKLKSVLFRWDCPTAQELGDYHFQLIDPTTATKIKDHLTHCVHCQAELEELTAFLKQSPQITPEPKIEKLLRGLPRPGDIIARLLPPLPHRAATGLRGDSQGPRILQADGMTLFIETEKQNSHFLIKGQLAADELEEWYGSLVQVVQGADLISVTSVDDEGGFQFQLDKTELVKLRIENSSGKAVVVQDISIV